MEEAPLLSELSNELIAHILSFVELAPDLPNVSLVCRALYEASHAPALWRRVLLPRMAHLITPPSHRPPSEECVGHQVFPDLLLAHVIEHHAEHVREIDLTLVPFTKDTCRMTSENQLANLVRQLISRCVRLERLYFARFSNQASSQLPGPFPGGMASGLLKSFPIMAPECVASKVRVLDLSGWPLNLQNVVQTFPNVTAASLAQIMNMPDIHNFQRAQTMTHDTYSHLSHLSEWKNLRYLDISSKSNQNFYDTLHVRGIFEKLVQSMPDLKTIIVCGCATEAHAAIQKSRPDCEVIIHPPHHLLQLPASNSTVLREQYAWSRVSNIQCFDESGDTLLHIAVTSPTHDWMLEKLINEIKVDVNVPSAMSLHDHGLIGMPSHGIYNQFYHSRNRRMNDEAIGGLYFPSPVMPTLNPGNVQSPWQTGPKPSAAGASALHVACAFGNEHAVISLLEQGARVDAIQDDGQTPLMTACHFGHENIVRTLLNDAHARADLQDTHGFTALHYAILGGPSVEMSFYLASDDAPKSGTARIIEMLLEAGTPIDHLDKSGCSALHLACAVSKLWLVQLLLKRGASVHVGVNPLFCLVLSDKMGNPYQAFPSVFGNGNRSLLGAPADATMKTLSEAGCPFDAINENGETLLHILCRERNFHLATKLLELAKRLDLDVQDELGWTPLHWLCNKPLGSEPLPNSFGAPQSQPQSSAASFLQVLMAKRPNINARAANGETPLLVAAIADLEQRISNLDLAQQQQQQSVAVQYPGQALLTPEKLKLRSEEAAEFIRDLISFGADAAAKDDNGWSVLHAFCVSGNVDMVKLVLASGADPNARDAKSVTPLMAAARAARQYIPSNVMNKAIDDTGLPATLQAYREVIEVLVEHGARTDIRDEIEGDTPLHLLAGERKYAELFEWILDHVPSSIQARNLQGESLLHTAVTYNNLPLVKLLLSRGINKLERSAMGETPLQTALRVRLHYEYSLLMWNQGDAAQENVLCDLFWPASAVSSRLSSFLSAPDQHNLTEAPTLTSFNSLGYPVWHEHGNVMPHHQRRVQRNSGFGQPSHMQQFASRRTEDNVKILFALIEAGLSEEECLAKDKFGLTALHYAAALGAYSLGRLSDVGLAYSPYLGNSPASSTSSSKVLSLYLVNYIARLFPKMIDEADERGDTALHKILQLVAMMPPDLNWRPLMMPATQSAETHAIDYEVELTAYQLWQKFNPSSRTSDKITSQQPEGAAKLARHSDEGEIERRAKEKGKMKDDADEDDDGNLNAVGQASRRSAFLILADEDDDDDEQNPRRVLRKIPRLPAVLSVSERVEEAWNEGQKWVNAVVGILVSAGANCNIKNRRGDTALHLACRAGLFRVVDQLLRSPQIDVNATTQAGETALHILLRSAAVRVGSNGGPKKRTAYEELRSLVKAMLEAGVDVNKMDASGQTALHVACMMNFISIVKLMTQHPGTDVNARETHSGMTPLMHAVRTIHPIPAALSLLRSGADHTITDASGRTAQALAGDEVWSIIWTKFTATQLDEEEDQANEADVLRTIHALGGQASFSYMPTPVFRLGAGSSRDRKGKLFREVEIINTLQMAKQFTERRKQQSMSSAQTTGTASLLNPFRPPGMITMAPELDDNPIETEAPIKKWRKEEGKKGTTASSGFGSALLSAPFSTRQILPPRQVNQGERDEDDDLLDEDLSD